MSLSTMIVVDTFQLEDGRTVFVGKIETEANVIPPCDCEILVGNEVKASLRIDGEEIPKGKMSVVYGQKLLPFATESDTAI